MLSDQPASHRQHILAEGRFLRLVNDGGWEYVERRNVGGIVTIAALARGGMLLVEQYRPPVRANVIELPAGLAGDFAGESLETAARRELLEETGYRAATLERLFEGPISAGMSTEILTFFRATGLEKVADGGGDGSEAITVHEIPLAEVEPWLAERTATGTLVDPKVYAGLHALRT